MKKHTKNTLIAILILLFNPITLYLAFFIYGESVKACKYPDDFEIFYRILNPLKEKYELAEADCGYSLNHIMWIKITAKDPQKVFDIAKDIYEIKQNSEFLVKDSFEVEITSGDPGVKMKYRIAGESGYRGYRKWQDGIQEDVKRLEYEYSVKNKEKEHGTTQILQ